jgi:hypothetical protein
MVLTMMISDRLCIAFSLLGSTRARPVPACSE